MDRFAFLEALPWLTQWRRSPDFTDGDIILRGCASFHISFQEQYQECSAIKGMTAPDASHLLFSPDESYPDTAQMSVIVQKIPCQQVDLPTRQADALLVTLDGQDFLLDATQVGTINVFSRPTSLFSSTTLASTSTLQDTPSVPRRSAVCKSTVCRGY